MAKKWKTTDRKDLESLIDSFRERPERYLNGSWSPTIKYRDIHNQENLIRGEINREIGKKLAPFFQNHPLVLHGAVIRHFSYEHQSLIDLSSIASFIMNLLTTHETNQIIEILAASLELDRAKAYNYRLYKGPMLASNIVINDHMRLVPLKEFKNIAVKEYLFSEITRFDPSLGIGFVEPYFVVEQIKEIYPLYVSNSESIDEQSLDTDKKEIQVFESALTVIFDAPIFYAQKEIFEKNELDAFFQPKIYFSYPSPRPFQFRIEPFYYESKLLETMREINSLNKDAYRRIRKVINRLSNVMYETDPKIVALELSIIYESIFTTKDENSEISHRIGIRAATFIHRDYEERMKTRKLIKSLYDIRSKFVHGDIAIDKSKVVIDNRTLQAYEIVRENIKIVQEILKVIIRLNRFPINKGAYTDFDKLDFGITVEE